MFLSSTDRKACIAPFLVFMLLLGLVELVPWLFKDSESLLVRSPQFWVFPLQTVVCGGLLIWFWSRYQFGHVEKFVFTLSVAVVVLVIWISPQALFHQPKRLDGFDPTVFASNRPLFIATLAMRFLRLVIVVPLLEEIFWRGFLLRDLIDEDFTRVPFGKFTWKSFAIVTALFGLAHWGADFWAAILTGALFNLVAYRTKSLASCVVVHAVTNLLLGIYIMQTKQWGFW